MVHYIDKLLDALSVCFTENTLLFAEKLCN
jgi:hypothetical protein